MLCCLVWFVVSLFLFDRLAVCLPAVERRRRDKINNWIVTLSKIIPDCNMDSSKTGAVSEKVRIAFDRKGQAKWRESAITGRVCVCVCVFVCACARACVCACVCACNFFFTVLSQSKGGILSKACDYIRELRQTNQRLQESFKDVEHTQVDNELLRQQVRPQTFTLQTASPLKATLCRFLQCFQFYKYDFVSS